MLCREVKDKFAGIEPDALRPSGRFDPNLRRQVKRDADALKAQFAGYFAPAAENREAADGRPLGIRPARQRLRDRAAARPALFRQPGVKAADPCRRNPRDPGQRRQGHSLRAPMGGGHRCRPDQDRAGARGPGLCTQTSHPAGRPRPGALATGLAAGHPRPAAGRGLRPAARGRSLGRHQRRAGLRPASGTVRRCRGSGRCVFIQRCG